MVRLDYLNLTYKEIGEVGLDIKDIEIFAKKAYEMMLKKPYKELDFLNLHNQDLLKIKQLSSKAKDYDYFIILGIGGSALGPKVILEALSPFHNLRRKPKVFVYDNVDPVTFKNIIEIVDLKRTLINVISKSGTTVETLASFLILWKMIRDKKLNVRQHFVFTTDPEKGSLRVLANEYGIPTLEIPKNIVGRYSVLSPVGVFLAEIIGTESESLLEGAKDISEKALNDDLSENSMAIFASCTYLMDTMKGRRILVFLPYSDRLKSLSEWFCQLWAESLGKEGKGPTPYPSLGTTDQHSQLQLWMEGPEDKVILFVCIENHNSQEEIPQEFHNIEGLKYLGGHTLSELINIEQLATEMALTMSKKPNFKLVIPRLNAYYLGQLFQFLQISTAMTGFLYNVNPFNQPGVELGKRLTYGAMGRRGFEEEAEKIKKYLRRKI
ncbi:MAG: glucose-6-phosphate isomerase [Thermodesulfovibrio sp.]|nr:glucose-6-phosphate isomerase [Thermodesulfovibrio sp.]